MTATKAEIFEFLQRHGLAVLASVAAGPLPEAALVEYAVMPNMDLIFDTLDSTRKCKNLRQNPHIACVIGWDGPETLQLEGVADEPSETELSELLPLYFASCPSGLQRQGWPGLTYFRIRPRWCRLSNYNRPRRVEEISLSD